MYKVLYSIYNNPAMLKKPFLLETSAWSMLLLQQPVTMEKYFYLLFRIFIKENVSDLQRFSIKVHRVVEPANLFPWPRLISQNPIFTSCWQYTFKMKFSNNPAVHNFTSPSKCREVVIYGFVWGLLFPLISYISRELFPYMDGIAPLAHHNQCSAHMYNKLVRLLFFQWTTCKSISWHTTPKAYNSLLNYLF